MTDLSLHQLLHMARTTFTTSGKGGSSRASLDLLWHQQQQQQYRGGSLSGMLGPGPAGSPPPGGCGPGSERRGQAPREDKVWPGCGPGVARLVGGKAHALRSR